MNPPSAICELLQYGLRRRDREGIGRELVLKGPLYDVWEWACELMGGVLCHCIYIMVMMRDWAREGGFAKAWKKDMGAESVIVHTCKI